jgi:hypothetical protein
MEATAVEEIHLQNEDQMQVVFEEKKSTAAKFHRSIYRKGTYWQLHFHVVFPSLILYPTLCFYDA